MEKLLYFILSIAVSACSIGVPVFADEISEPDSAYTLPTDKSAAEDNSVVNETDNTVGGTEDKYTDGESSSDKNSNTDSKYTNGSESKTANLSAADKNTSDSIHLEFKMIPRMQVKDSTAEFYLYDSAGNLVAEASEWVGGITEKLSFDISVPRYKLGESFSLKLNGGLT